MSDIRYSTFPRTSTPHPVAAEVAEAFCNVEDAISTKQLEKGLKSDAVTSLVRPGLERIGFTVESDKTSLGTIDRPVLFGENGLPSLNYQVDAYHNEYACGLEIEAGRALMGNAFYRDLVQAMVMVRVETLIVALPNTYKYKSSGKLTISRDYHNACGIADALYAHGRLHIPFSLILLGY
tara:strand:- start:603183 stop:603722 length:540 start_codon:yes stop_codon:yes gene_type:complete